MLIELGFMIGKGFETSNFEVALTCTPLST